jgi:pilus assembly protein TadC
MKTNKEHPAIEMLRSEIELMVSDRDALLRIAGAAAKFVEKVNITKLSVSVIPLAEALSSSVNALTEETLKESLTAIKKRRG